MQYDNVHLHLLIRTDDNSWFLFTWKWIYSLKLYGQIHQSYIPYFTQVQYTFKYRDTTITRSKSWHHKFATALLI
jgi:hypothetical protein